MNSDPRHLRLRVSGKVLGVQYCNHVKDQADRLGLNGEAKELPNGEVQIDVEGADQPLGAFLELTKTGPFYQVVDAVELSQEPAQGFTGFKLSLL